MGTVSMEQRGTLRFSSGEEVTYARVGARDDIGAFLMEALKQRAPLPETVVIKPNLNKDLMALTGNSVDFRVLVPLLSSLRDLGVRDITLAEGFNVGVDRRGLDGMKRLRVDRLARRFGARLVDLNQSRAVPVGLTDSTGWLASEVTDAAFVINVCKIKTHAEAVMSCALKNWVGISVGHHKRRMHDALAENIVRVNEIVKPHLVLVDGLVAMEGNGPADGDPVRLDLLLAGSSSFAVDMVVARLIGLRWEQVPALAAAVRKGLVAGEDGDQAWTSVPALSSFRQAPARSRLAVLSESPRLAWLKRMVRPLVTEGPLLQLAYELKIVQDVYSMTDDTVAGLAISSAEERRHRELLTQVCPVGWGTVWQSALQDGQAMRISDSPECLQCLNCYWALPEGAVQLTGDLGYLALHVAQFKHKVERALQGPARAYAYE